MARTLSEFIVEFVVPLLGGGSVKVARPVRPKDYRAMAGELGAALGDPDLTFLRLRRAQLLVADPVIPDIDIDELGLWVGLHNTLALDHPDRDRVWARAVTWRRVESVSRTLLTLDHVPSFDVALARHLAVGPFISLKREDHIITTVDGEERFAGQPVPKRRLRFTSLQQLGARDEVIEWLADRHMPEVQRLIQDALWASPITCLMNPLAAPPGWSPLIAAPFLFQRGFARAVCHSWAASPQWIDVGGAVMDGLLAPLRGETPGARRTEEDPTAQGDDQDADGPRALLPGGAVAALPGSSYGAGPREIGAIVGSLIHVHFLKVLELGARLGVAATSRDRPVQMFLALPLLLPRLDGTLGQPLPHVETFVSGFDGHVARRWTEYCDHLGELIPQPVVENLVATLVPRIVKASSA